MNTLSLSASQVSGGSMAPLRSRALLLVIIFAAVVLPFMASPYGMQLATRIMILAILAMSLDLLVGVTGLVSLAHAAFYGAAAYLLYWLSPEYDPASLLTSLPLAVAGAGAIAFVIGILALRTSGIYFIMVTLAFAQLGYFVAHDTWLGGDSSDGVFIYFKPQLQLGGTTLLDLDDRLQFYGLCAALAVGTYLILRQLLAAPFGRALCGIRVNEHRMRAIGYPTFAYKLAAFTVAGALAGLAGYLEACQYGFVNPELMSWHISGFALMMVILGGKGHFGGAALGAAAFVLLEEVLANDAIVGRFAEYWQLGLGAIIVLVVLFLPKGLSGIRWPRRASGGREEGP